jgi:hypothetical protein
LLTVHHDIRRNENRLDALFILDLFCNQPVYVSGMFIAHHQEVFTVYVQQLVRVIPLSSILTQPAASRQMYNTYQLLYIYIYSEYLLMMGNKQARNM